MNASPTNMSATHGADVVYDMVDLPPFESRRENVYKLARVFKDLVDCINDARVEFVFMSEEERMAFATRLMNALLK